MLLKVKWTWNIGSPNPEARRSSWRFRRYIGIMESKMATTLVYWGCIGIMENRRETTIV